MGDKIDHYELNLRAGPGLTSVEVDVYVYDADGREIGQWNDTAMGFGYTWLDVARVVVRAADDADGGSRHINDVPSPHVDLT